MSFFKKIWKATHPGLSKAYPFQSGPVKKAAPWVGAAIAAYFGYPYALAALGSGGGAAAAGAAGGIDTATAAGALGGAGAAGTAMSTTVTGSSPSWLSSYGGLLSGGLSGAGQLATNSANAKMAQQQMDFQQQMSSTAYQRAVQDMQAAGLNPMLAYSQGGASTPGGSTASMNNALGEGVASALQGRQTIANTENIIATTQRTDEETELTRARARGEQLENILRIAREPQIHAETHGSTASAQQAEETTRRIKALLPHEISQLKSQSRLTGLEADKASVMKGLYELVGPDLISTAKGAYQGAKRLIPKLGYDERRGY